MTAGTCLHVVIAGFTFGCLSLASAEEPRPSPVDAGHAQHRELQRTGEPCGSPTFGGGEELENVQIETSEIKLYEELFESILQARIVQRLDHPQKDFLRAYCYRGLLIVVRQDVQRPRPTGWVQINFSVQDVSHIQDELQRSYEGSSVSKLEESERSRIVGFHLKPDVKRGDRKARRLEVAGPEGFMIGFDQYK